MASSTSYQTCLAKDRIKDRILGSVQRGVLQIRTLWNLQKKLLRKINPKFCMGNDINFNIAITIANTLFCDKYDCCVLTTILYVYFILQLSNWNLERRRNLFGVRWPVNGLREVYLTPYLKHIPIRPIPLWHFARFCILHLKFSFIYSFAYLLSSPWYDPVHHKRAGQCLVPKR